MSDLSIESIRRDIQSHYRSLENPDYHFLNTGRGNRPYQGIVDDLFQRFYLKDATDPNQDVSLVLVILPEKHAENGEFMLQLSFVGPYGVLFQLTAKGPRLVNKPDASPAAKTILDLTAKWRVSILSAEVLSEPIPLKLFYTDPENVRVYQALFSDVDILPWEAELAAGCPQA